MPLDGQAWGTLVAAAVKSAAAGVTPGTPISDAQLQTIWKAICQTHDDYISNNAFVQVFAVQTGVGSANGQVS